MIPRSRRSRAAAVEWPQQGISWVADGCHPKQSSTAASAQSAPSRPMVCHSHITRVTSSASGCGLQCVSSAWSMRLKLGSCCVLLLLVCVQVDGKAGVLGDVVKVGSSWRGACSQGRCMPGLSVAYGQTYSQTDTLGVGRNAGGTVRGDGRSQGVQGRGKRSTLDSEGTLR